MCVGLLTNLCDFGIFAYQAHGVLAQAGAIISILSYVYTYTRYVALQVRCVEQLEIIELPWHAQEKKK